MKPITIWLRFDDETRRFHHNHIEDGHVRYDKESPTPRSAMQKSSWKNAWWSKTFAYLDGARVQVKG